MAGRAGGARQGGVHVSPTKTGCRPFGAGVGADGGCVVYDRARIPAPTRDPIGHTQVSAFVFSKTASTVVRVVA